ncbi:MAG: Uma2 family endonuclease [Pirellulaceae bacterium]
MATDIKTLDQIDYPERDGRPMGETDLHRDWMIRLIRLLQFRYRDQRAYVSGDLLLYYVEGNPKVCVVPDVFLVKDHPPGRRRVYKLWEEGQSPHVVIEVTSLKTRKADVLKLRKFREIGVAEVFLYDPTGDYLNPPLHGYRLVGGEYVTIEPNAESRLSSVELHAELGLEDDGSLAIHDADSGERWLTAEEAAEAEIQRLRQRLRELGQ